MLDGSGILAIIRRLLVLILVAGVFWHFYGETFEDRGFQGVVTEISADFHEVKEHPVIRNTWERIKQEVQMLSGRIADNLPTDEASEPTLATPDLNAPSEQVFSVHNIELGDDRANVEGQLGEPKRTSRNEYGVNWVTYHENYQNFMMVSYDEADQVNGLYTNNPLLSSTNGITFDSSREEVLSIMPKPLKSMRKGFINYQIQDNGEYNVFELDSSYATIFYDKHEGSTVTAILIIDEELEREKEKYFTDPSEELREGLEYQLFDLTNAARVQHGLSVLAWEEPARETVRDHSKDMAVNDYFSHTNLEGQSPFDRLAEDAISYQMAGENLAAGQPSSIFAHEGLMNSLGHRENKLRSGYESLAVGVAFNQDAQPFYTENYLSD